MFLSISKVVIFPIISDLLFNYFLHGRFPIVDRAVPRLSLLGIAILSV